MTRRNDSFSNGGTWRRPDNDRDRGHGQSELRDYASYDQTPKKARSCAATLLVSLALWVLVLTAAVHLIGSHS